MQRSYWSCFIPGSYMEWRKDIRTQVLSCPQGSGTLFVLIAQLTRCALYLQQFSMTIHYRPVSTKNADGLSRQSWNIVDKDVADLERGGDVKVTPEYPEETGLATKKVPSKTMLCPSNI